MESKPTYKTVRVGTVRKIIGALLILATIGAAVVMGILGVSSVAIGLIFGSVGWLPILIGWVIMKSGHDAKMEVLSYENPDEYWKIEYNSAHDKSKYCNACYRIFSGINESPTNLSWETTEHEKVTEHGHVTPAGTRVVTGVDRNYTYECVMAATYSSDCAYCGKTFECTKKQSYTSANAEYSFNQAKILMQNYFNEKGWGSIDSIWNNVKY